MDGRAAPLDRISALPDDLLHVILSFLGDAAAVTRTAVLSRRWRHVWIHAKSLTFRDGDLTKNNVPGHFAGFVDWALAKRGDAKIESLRIRAFNPGCTSPDQANEWLRYAARRVVKSVDFHLSGLSDRQVVIELPSHGVATCVYLHLNDHSFQLPAAPTARYEALTELKLFNPLFSQRSPGSGSTLGDFVTSCCPRLRRIEIEDAKGLPHLVLQAEALEELEVILGKDLQTLDVTAPNLRVVRLEMCFINPTDLGTNIMARIIAPKLEEIAMSDFHIRKPNLDVHHLTSVRRLKDIYIDMHGKYYRDTDIGLWLLENCPNVQDVNVVLWHCVDNYVTHREPADLAPFANVKTLAVRGYYFQRGHFTASVSSLLKRCPHITSLSVDTSYLALESSKYFCYAFTDACTIDGKIALESLEEVKIIGFGGTDEEMRLVSLLFESSFFEMEESRRR